MPKSPTKQEAPADPMLAIRDAADALYRAAVECFHQHERLAKVAARDGSELEHEHAEKLCEACDGSLGELADAYSDTAAHVHPTVDEAWWHKANAMWHASREYARRHAGCDRASRRLKAKHSPSELAALNMEYELEASALLALRHAADAYCKARPDAA